MTGNLFQVLLLAIPLGLPIETASPSVSGMLEAGYRHMYNLEFDQAHMTFQSWEQSHPDDPMGPTSDAAAILYSEFNRLGVLQAALFADDEALRKFRKPAPDPHAKKCFEDAMATSERLADTILARSPSDENALFAKVLNQGLLADYDGLIEKHLVASLEHMRAGRLLARKLLSLDSACYDAYLAIGVENYVVGSSPAPVRWFLQLFGSQADKRQGLETLELTARQGHYLMPFARLLLAVAAIRDRKIDEARQLLEGLAREFPNNPLYAREAARIK